MNVVSIMLDSLRQDHVSFYNGGQPVFEALAVQGPSASVRSLLPRRAVLARHQSKQRRCNEGGENGSYHVQPFP